MEGTRGIKEKMKTAQGDNRFDSRRFIEDIRNTRERMRRDFDRPVARGARRFTGTFVRIFMCAMAISLFPVLRIGAQSAQQWKLPDIPWAFPVRDKVQPVIDARTGLI